MIALAPYRTRSNTAVWNRREDEYARELAQQYTVEELTAARDEYRRRYEIAVERAVQVFGEVYRAHGKGRKRLKSAERVTRYLRESAEVLTSAAMYAKYVKRPA